MFQFESNCKFLLSVGLLYSQMCFKKGKRNQEVLKEQVTPVAIFLKSWDLLVYDRIIVIIVVVVFLKKNIKKQNKKTL